LDTTHDSVQSGNIDVGAAAGRWGGRIEALLESYPEVARDLADLVREIERGLTPARGPSNQTVNADRGSYASGRDMRVDQRRKKTNYGGLVAGAVAVVVVIAVLLIGRAVYVNLIESNLVSGMNEKTTCREFLAADPQTQGSVMRRLYLKANHPDRAGDPFIAQNAEYDCGSSPDMTLGQLATR